MKNGNIYANPVFDKSTCVVFINNIMYFEGLLVYYYYIGGVFRIRITHRYAQNGGH